MRLPVEMRFDVYGGPVLSAGYRITDAAGREVVTVDVASFTDDVDAQREEHPEARRIADLIVAALNASQPPEADRGHRACRYGPPHDESGPLRPCPYQADVHNDPAPYCHCCAECAQDCADDV